MIISDYDPMIIELVDVRLFEGLIEGVFDVIATDHAPHAIEDKERDFKNASCGMIGLESAFGLVNKNLSDKMKIESIIDLFTVKPAKIINLNPHLIQEGSLAELNVINPNYKWIFNENYIQSKSKNTPIIGKELMGKVLITINKGYISNCKIS